MEIIKETENMEYRKLSFGQVFSESQRLYPRLIGLGVLTVIIYLIASALVALVFEKITGYDQVSAVFLEEIQGMDNINKMMDKVMAFYQDNFLVTLLTQYGTKIILLLSFPLAGGFMLVCREMDKNGFASASTLFEAFKPHYWGRLMILILTYFILSTIGLMLFVIPGIYIWVAAVLACPFVMFTDKSGIEALKASIKMVNQDWFTVFKILFVATLIGFSGYLLCGIGRIFTYPFVLISIYVLYKQMVGFNDDAISDIGKE